MVAARESSSTSMRVVRVKAESSASRTTGAPSSRTSLKRTSPSSVSSHWPALTAAKSLEVSLRTSGLKARGLRARSVRAS